MLYESLLSPCPRQIGPAIHTPSIFLVQFFAMDTHSHEIAEVPEAARVITMALSMITISVLAICLSKTA